MDSFGKVIVGTISNSMTTNGGLITNETSVMSTVLGETQELAWLNDFPPYDKNNPTTFQQSIAGGGGRCLGSAPFVF
jgi:hypothetical protein